MTINRLVEIVEDIAGIQLTRRHKLGAPQGVRDRNSDNSLIRQCSAGSLRSRCNAGWRKRVAGFYDQMSVAGVLQQMNAFFGNFIRTDSGGFLPERFR